MVADIVDRIRLAACRRPLDSKTTAPIRYAISSRTSSAPRLVVIEIGIMLAIAAIMSAVSGMILRSSTVNSPARRPSSMSWAS